MADTYSLDGEEDEESDYESSDDEEEVASNHFTRADAIQSLSEDRTCRCPNCHNRTSVTINGAFRSVAHDAFRKEGGHFKFLRTVIIQSSLTYFAEEDSVGDPFRYYVGLALIRPWFTEYDAI